jgi:hypothetical protein
MGLHTYKPNYVVIESGPLGERIIAGAESITVARAAFDAASPFTSHALLLQQGARIICRREGNRALASDRALPRHSR